MKKTIFTLIALLSALNINAQVIEIYENGRLINTYNNTPRTHFKVKFTELGNTTNIDGHEFVEIGGLKWATMNVGAKSVADMKETAYGDFYAWGETCTYYLSYPDKQDVNNNPSVSWKIYEPDAHIPGKKYSHNWVCYSGGPTDSKDPLFNKFKEWEPCPYDASYTMLDENDVVRKEWGSSWRMPTYNDYSNLFDACGGAENFQATAPEHITTGGIYWIKEGTTVDDFTYNVAGVLFVATENVDKRVFFPAAGNLQNIKRTSSSTLCTYWSATVHPDADKHHTAFNLYINESGVNKSHMWLSRAYGFSVRPVSD